MVKNYIFLIILFLVVIIVGILIIIPKQNHLAEHFESTDEYTDFFNLMTSSAIELQDRCNLAKQKIQDKKDGLQINAQIVNAATNFINDQCSGKPKKMVQNYKVDINPKDKDAVLNYYQKYCIPKYGELRDTVPFDNYRVEEDEKGIQYFNGKQIDQLELTKENCRRMEEYKKNQKKNSIGLEKPLSVDNLYNDCLQKYSVQTDKVGAYNYYLSRDGKYYLNSEPLERINLNKGNCRIIQDIMDKDKADKSGNLTITLDKLDESQKHILCKRSNELDLICSVYDKEKVIEYGKNHDKELVLYQYEIAPEKYEYSFLTPTEHAHITTNISRGRSGLTADNEIDLCYRKHLIDRECRAAKVRMDI